MHSAARTAPSGGGIASMLSTVSHSAGLGSAAAKSPPDAVHSIDVACVFGATGADAVVQTVTFRRADGATTRFGTATVLAQEQDSFVLMCPREFVVRVRGNVAQTLVGIQFVTNLGRHSPWYGGTAAGTRFEFASEPPGLAVVGLHVSGSTHNLRLSGVVTQQPPAAAKPTLTSLMLSSSVREVMLSGSGRGDRSLVMKLLRGGRQAVSVQALRSGVVSRVFASDEGLMRLLLQSDGPVSKASTASLPGAAAAPAGGGAAETALEGVPSSVLAALNERGAFEHSCMDLMLSGRERAGRTPVMRLFFAKSRVTGESVSSMVFRRASKTAPSLAAELFLPDRARGLRSLMQLMTDDELLADASRPSLLRMCLFGEDQPNEKSVLRLMLERSATRGTSVMDEMLHGEEAKARGDGEPGGSAVRRLLHTPVVRTMLTDTPTGKPALGRYLFGSMLKLCVQGEERDQASLLRLLLTRRRPLLAGSGSLLEGRAQWSVLDLLLGGTPSVLDVMHRGEETSHEMSLMRLCLGVTLVVRDGRVVIESRDVDAMAMEEALGGTGDASEPHPHRAADVLRRGLTIAGACCLGEERGGPGISALRVLLMGEDTNSHSILRLLLTGEERGEMSPLRVILTGAQAALVASQVVLSDAGDASDAATWAERSRAATETVMRVARAIQDAVERSHNEGSTWQETFAKLAALAKDATAQAVDGLNVAFLYTAFARLRELGPEFAQVWRTQCGVIAAELRRAAERTADPESAWRVLAPQFADVVVLIGEQRVTETVVKGAAILGAIEAVASRGQSTLVGRAADAAARVMQTVVGVVDGFAGSSSRG